MAPRRNDDDAHRGVARDLGRAATATVNSRFLPAPCRSARPHAIPARRPAGHESAGEDSVLAPRSAARSFTLCRYCARQKSPTNNPLGQRISHPGTVLGESPTAAYASYLDSPRENQEQARPGKGTRMLSQFSLGEPDRRPLPPATTRGRLMTRVLAPCAWACILSSKCVAAFGMLNEGPRRQLAGGHRVELSCVTYGSRGSWL